jgi:hypothetical protein
MRVGVISDVHWIVDPPTTSSGWHGSADLHGTLERVESALARFKEAAVDVVVLAGDVSHHGDEDSIAAVLTTCAVAGAPVLVVAGNHDVVGEHDQLAAACAQAGATGVALADPNGSVHRGVRVAGVHVGTTVGWFRAQLRELPDVLRWGTDPVVLVSHYPVLSLATTVSDAGLPYPGDLLDRPQLSDLLLSRRAPTVVVGGHVHARATLHDGPVLQLTAGALAEPPYECALVDVEHGADGRCEVSRRSLRLRAADGAHEPVFAPDLESWLFDGSQWQPTNTRPSAGHGEEQHGAQHRQDPDHPHRKPSPTGRPRRAADRA